MMKFKILVFMSILMLAISCQKDGFDSAIESEEIELRGDYLGPDPDDATNGEGNECDIPNSNIRILFIGNSYTDNYTTELPQMFEELAYASGRTVGEVASRCKNGWTLTDHLNSTITLNKINQGNWDYVILQENAGYLLNGNNATWNEFNQTVSSLTQIIRIQSPGVQVKLFQLPPPFHHASGSYSTVNSQWNSNFSQIANFNPDVEVSRISTAFNTSYTASGTPGLGSNGSDLLRGSSTNYHFLNTGGFLAATTFYADIYQDKPCVPEYMTFTNGVYGLVDNYVYNKEEILQIGYVTGYNLTFNAPPPYIDCTMYVVGNGPCN